MKKVFLCHASEDKEYVRIVAKKLTRAKVIFDEISFEVAADFRDQILKGLDDTKIFVFMVSCDQGMPCSLGAGLFCLT